MPKRSAARRAKGVSTEAPTSEPAPSATRCIASLLTAALRAFGRPVETLRTVEPPEATALPDLASTSHEGVYTLLLVSAATRTGRPPQRETQADEGDQQHEHLHALPHDGAEVGDEKRQHAGGEGRRYQGDEGAPLLS